jgi:hypothetical protein
MDEMNQFEKQLQSWTPRRPSSKIARRLFGIAGEAAMPLPRAASWNWLAPVAACALTMLVALHTSSLATAPLASRNNSGSLFTIMLNAASSSSNFATFSLSQMDENMEFNIWPHATHHLTLPPPAEPRARLDLFNVIPTNR